MYGVWCALGLGLLLTFSFGRDQGIYGVVAERWRHGVWPYEGAWDFKPPGIFLVFSAIQFALGTGEAGLRCAEVLATAALLALIFRYSREVLRSDVVGLVAGMLAVLTHLQLDFWHTAQPETFAAPALVATLLLAKHDGLAATVTLGFIGGFLFLVKPPFGAAAAMPLLVRLYSARDDWRRSFVTALTAALAAAVPIAVTAFAFHRAGALDALRETLFVFAPRYTALGWTGETFATLVYKATERSFTGLSGLIALGLALRIAAKKPWAPQSELLAMLAVCILGTALQAKFFPYHFGAILPIEAIVAAEGLVWAFASSAFAARAALLILAVCMGFGRGPGRDVTGSFAQRARARIAAYPAFIHGNREPLDALDKAADLDNGQNRALALWFQSLTTAAEPVFLFGFEPSVYLFAERRPATRYIYDVPLRAENPRPHRERLMRDLRQSLPRAIAIERHDRMKMVTGTGDDSAETAHEFPEFMAFLGLRYRRATDLGRFERWVIREKADTAPGSDTLSP